ncbi:uncharacterized protein M6B38_376435 [Iris pallida]|uniref:Uncharacterized protein n=1 Tax=Iris pallida TaxID=29817 RepID=A0AAX6G9T5_IRIPA|nr:uncharacterized protein M6B38_376435 [Iris pallida]
MSIALERIGRPGFADFGVYEDPTAAEAESYTSSVGRNSDSSGEGSDGGEESEEVQSSLKGPLDTMDALEDSLPIRRGISKFYCGKSKSFTSLADAQCSSSSRDLAKSQNSYTRKRKSLPTFGSTLWDKTCSNSLRYDEDSAVSKRPANSRRTTVGHCHPESSSSGSNSNSNGSGEEDHHDHGYSRQLPPLHPHGKLAAQKCSSPMGRRPSFKTRSFSLTDLEGVSSSSSSASGVKQKMFH